MGQPQSGGVRSPAIFIIEGPDGAGKTTLARRLAETYRLDYHHEGPPQTDKVTQYYIDLLLDAHGQNARVVFDRLALGETVYGPVLRGRNALGFDGWSKLMTIMANVEARHVVCLPPPKVCRDNWWERVKGDDELFSEQTTFYRTYSEFAHLVWRHDMQVHDYTTESYEAFLVRWGDAPRSRAGLYW